MTVSDIFIHQLIRSWESQVAKTTKLLTQLTDDQLMAQVSPGKNRGIYIFGHLIAIHDAMPEILGIGKRNLPDLHAAFVQNQENSESSYPELHLLRTMWDSVHLRLSDLLPNISLEEWMARHHAVTPAEFLKEPSRNKISVLLGRTNHLSYHLGQLRLLS